MPKSRKMEPISPRTEQLARRLFALYAPPEDLSVPEWAEKYRVLSRENSAEAGPWRNRRTPYLVEPMRAFTDPAVRHITVVASSQVGKSELELNIIGYIIDQDPGSILYVQPTLDDAKKFSRQRVSPMIRDTPPLRRKVADVKSRDGGNTILQKQFPGGLISIVGSQAASGLASLPARYVIGDERDRWAISAGSEGDPWKLAVARTTTYYNAKLVDVSTPTIRGASAIEKTYTSGTMEHWSYQCPDCGEWSELKFGDVKFEYREVVAGRKRDYDITSVAWACPHCGAMQSEEKMRAQPAKWIAENPEALSISGHRSFKISAFASPWVPWTTIVYKFLTSKDDPHDLQVFYNTVIGEWWEERGDVIDADEAISRREDYGTLEDGAPADAPPGVILLTMGVDVQDDRLEYEIVGHGHYRETWGIKYGVLMGNPDDSAVWNRLDEVIQHEYRRADGKALRVRITFVDSGGHKTQSVYFQTRQRPRVYAIKGKGGDGVPYTRPPAKVKIVVDGRSIGTTWLYTLGVDEGKADIMASMRVREPGPRCCHFPFNPAAGYDSRFFEGLLSERLVNKNDGKNAAAKWVWEKISTGSRNEPLDCRNYALAAFRALDPDLDREADRLRGASAAAPPTQTATVREAAQRAERNERAIKSSAYNEMMTEW